MEHRAKRQKTNNPVQTGTSVHHGGGDGTGRWLESNSFNGQGISNHHGHVEIHGSFTVNNNNSDTTRTNSLEEHRRLVLETLRFPQIDARLQNIKNAHSKTCQWFLNTPKFLHWLDTSKSRKDSHFLWVKGKPGAGKSTLMKFVAAKMKKYNQLKKQTIVTSFFFNARGDDLEQSTVGMYRSLLSQLFKARPSLEKLLDSYSDSPEWSVTSLETLFEDTTSQLGEDSLVCLIDALDECDESQIREMVGFLRGLASSPSTRLQVCFASRYYPHITAKGTVELFLEEQRQHAQDITNYLDSMLHIGESNLAQQIQFDLQEKASGVFMWVVLVVDMLNKDYDCGRIHGGRIKAIQERLLQIPKDLHDLFRDILTRDSTNTQGLVSCIQWILFAKRPLTPLQLFYAILTGSEPGYIPVHNPEEVTDEVIRKYILDNSKGLAEYTNSEEVTVQFIHESVRDFLLKDKGLAAIWPNLATNPEGQSHEYLKNCCFDYMSAKNIIELIPDGKLPKAKSPECVKLRDTMSQSFPLIDYVSQSILYHAEKAQSHGFDQSMWLTDFPYLVWIKHHNVFQKHTVRRYTLPSNPLYILAEANLAALISVFPLGFFDDLWEFKRFSDWSSTSFALDDNPFGAPIFAALANQNHKAFQALLERDATIHLQEWPRWSNMSPEARNKLMQSKAGVAELCRQRAKSGCQSTKFNRKFQYNKVKGSKVQIAELGDAQLLEIALDGNWDEIGLEAEHAYGRPLLSFAMEHENEDTVRCLVDHGADIKTPGKYGHMSAVLPLSFAASKGHTSIVQLLLNKGANIEGRNINGLTALHYVAGAGNTAGLKLLLDRGANIESHNPQGWTALHYTARFGLTSAVELLLDRGANIESHDAQGRTALHHATLFGNITAVQLLLDRGANMETHSVQGRTALHYAAEAGNTAGLKLLLDHGANIESHDVQGRTALHYVAEAGNTAGLKLLLDCGANIKSHDARGWTALHYVTLFRNISAVELLLDRGANIESRDADRCTVLSMEAIR